MSQWTFGQHQFQGPFDEVKCLYYLMNCGPKVSMYILDRTKYLGPFGVDQVSQ